MQRSDGGYSLVEMMVVVLILGILIGISVPTLLGYRHEAQDRAAQSALRNSLLAEKTFFLDNEQYTETAAELSALQPGTVYAADPDHGVYLDLRNGDATVVCMVRTSESGTTFAIWEHVGAGTFYGATDLSAADCPAVPPAGYRPDGF
jgi:prepilin-type N-terminal cleavage/methylation domain-containing protein